ncbi:ribosome maturation factor RimM [Caldichromatium japonicum]|uniref:Ribosome maturation factor RimM n=1 Tax=Caldichromatium japonicum TaxID=2699430 RepID=A0A6G7VCI4_9GAMM|nr:ribosome maturation factor RimM [Caldichromatium japonicum]QIK37662.1 ribosome maturation factor RimM [Caldichromatium japonicum]
MAAATNRRVVLGQIVGLYGVRGWVKIHSETEPREGILNYSPWLVGPQGEVLRVLEGRRQGKGLVAHLDGCHDRDQAAHLVGLEIAVWREQLPPPGPDEFYWTDLEGLSVITETGVDLGCVTRLFATGANDVLVVAGERERLIPFVWDQVILEVDCAQGLIRVDWDPEF